MITNVVVAPNIFLKAYGSFTIGIDRPFSLNGQTISHPPVKLNTGSLPYDSLFANDITVHSDAEYLSLIAPSFVTDKKFLDSTKKAIFKFNKHPSVAPQEFIANYSLDGVMLAPSGTHVLEINSLAKDGDEFEIYGLSEIKKFFCSPLEISMNPVPYLLTISLFN